MKIKVYVAGPYTIGDVAVNVRRAFEVANDLADNGFAPYVPHGTHFWHIICPRPYEFWLEHDKEYLICCDAVYRIRGESKGADKEVEFAEKNGIPIFYEISKLLEYKKQIEKGG